MPARLAQKTVEFLQPAENHPFLALLSFYSVHTPLMDRSDLLAKYEAKSIVPTVWGIEGDRQVRQTQNHAMYAAMTEAMDDAVGMVLTALDSFDLMQNTFIIFTFDNGGLSTFEGHPTSNAPLRAGKGWMCEGRIHVPLLMRWFGHLEARRVDHTPIISPDFMPTFVELADPSPPPMIDGMSLLPILMELDQPKRDLYWHYSRYGNQGGSPLSAAQRGDWKLVQFYGNNSQEIYNLSQDVSESRDLASNHVEILDQFSYSLDVWLHETNARMPTLNPSTLIKSDSHE